jgi:hypothetical protein
MISFHLEFFPKQVGTLDIHSVKNGHHLSFIGGFSQVSLTNLFTSKDQLSTFLHDN